MFRFIGTRLVQMLGLFVVFLSILFFLLHAQPGDISQQFIGNPNIPPEARDILKRELGLDRPLHHQYLSYMTNFFKGNMGVSFQHYPRPVTDILVERLPRTLVLFLTATILAYYVGFVLGKILAWKRGKLTEHLVTVGGVLLFTVFYPWFALLMIWMFAFILGWFPVGKFITVEFWRGAPFAANEVFAHIILTAGIASLAMFALIVVAQRFDDLRTGKLVRRGGTLLVILLFLAYWWVNPMRPYAANMGKHLMLPVITLTMVAFAGIMLLTRSSMLETLREDYILTARAKGLPDHVIRDRHAARNALLPVTTSLVLALAFVISGGIITETVFSWPGIGLTLLEAVVQEDIPLAVGTLSIVGVLALVGHLAVDILYMYLDPRIRY